MTAAVEAKTSARADLAVFEDRHKLIGTSAAFAALTRIRSTIFDAVHSYFSGEGYVNLGNFTTPSGGVSGACEDPASVTRMQFGMDGEWAILPQTGQQYSSCFLPAHDRLWWISKSFRAETTQPHRRATVFTMVECEVNDRNLVDIQDVQGELLIAVAHALLTKRRDDLETLGAPIERLQNGVFNIPSITYTEAIVELQACGSPIVWGDDLKHEHEMKLLALHGERPLFVTHYPEAIRFFNMHTDPAYPDVVFNSDLLLPGVGETFGASQREHRVDKLRANLAKFARDPQRVGNLHHIGVGSPEELEEGYSWLLSLPEVQHSGFGMGIERLVLWAIGGSDIREAMEIPRWAGYMLP